MNCKHLKEFLFTNQPQWNYASDIHCSQLWRCLSANKFLTKIDFVYCSCVAQSRIAQRHRRLINQQLQLNRQFTTFWQPAHVVPRLVALTMLLFPLDFPSYVLLEIVDWLPGYRDHAVHHLKIQTIINTMKSCHAVVDRRT